VVDREGVIVVCHVRLRAAKNLGLTLVPVHVAANLTPAQVRACRLMHNRSHEEVEWDIEMLGANSTRCCAIRRWRRRPTKRRQPGGGVAPIGGPQAIADGDRPRIARAAQLRSSNRFDG